MTNYKLYFKLLKKHIPQAMIYFFFFCLILITNLIPKRIEKTDQYQIFIVGDEKSSICQEIKEYLEESKNAHVSFFKANLLQVSEEERENEMNRLMQEAVLSDVVNCLIKVSEEGETRIEVITNHDDIVSYDIEKAVIAALTKGESREKVKDATLLSAEIEARNDYIRRYLNIIIYGLSTIVCVGIISVNASMNKRELKERRGCAPDVNDTEVDLLKCHFLLGLLISSCLFLPVALFDYHLLFSVKGLLLGVNVLLVTANIVMMGYLLSIFIQNLSLEMIAVNVVSLGTLFMSGTLKEQWAISKLAIRVGSFIPTFWYVKANNLIFVRVLSDRESHREIMETMSIEILFFIALFIIGLIVRKQKLEEEAQ